MAAKLTLTITDCDVEDAVRILQVLRGAGSGELLITRDGACPTGHTYRELTEASRRGELVAAVTPKGLLVTQEALDDYRRSRTARRRPRSRVTTDPDAEARRALEARGIPTREPEE